jgi:hypothetical protein
MRFDPPTQWPWGVEATIEDLSLYVMRLRTRLAAFPFYGDPDAPKGQQVLAPALAWVRWKAED